LFELTFCFCILLFCSLKSHDEKQLQERIEKLLNILSGEITIGVHMQFLIKNNHADLLILKQIKVKQTNQKLSSFFYYSNYIGCCTQFSMSYSNCYRQWLYVIGYNK